ncbi:hypothetical protein FOL47_007087 [Perkinsus chesapeaki]|uniref:Uncharacterized protein n=1 Tax=Perkinsus chesapeaki TaxID=330153 RepID=A0A7J6LMX0_PERCH|nr:hypothetical protein FOL47_007087 [Perkinsus chesapeaki]
MCDANPDFKLTEALCETRYEDGLLKFANPTVCHFNATQLLKEILETDIDAPQDLQLITQDVGGRDVIAFIPTFGEYGDADLQMFGKQSAGMVVPWTRKSIWYSSPEHSTIHGIYCSNTQESDIIIDMPFDYYGTYDPMAITGPQVSPAELNMSTRGGLIAQLKSEVMSSLIAVKRVELPTKLNGSDSTSGTYDDYSVPRTIVDFSDLPQAGDVSGEYSRFDSFRSDAQAFSRMTQFSRTTCEDMIGSNVWSHADQSKDPSMGYPKILQADPAYYYDYCVKEFTEGKLQWQLTMRPLECRNSDFDGPDSNSYVVLRGVPHVAWYLYGSYPTIEDCRTDSNFDGDLYFQVQSDCNSRDGSWACMTPGKCQLEVEAETSPDYNWIAYLVITLVAMTVAVFLGTRAYMDRRGATAAGAAAKAEPMGVDGVLILPSGAADLESSAADQVGPRQIPKLQSPGARGKNTSSQRSMSTDSHFGMPMQKVIKVLAAAKAQMHPEGSSGSATSSNDSRGSSPQSSSNVTSRSDWNIFSGWRLGSNNGNSSDDDSGRNTSVHFTGMPIFTAPVTDPMLASTLTISRMLPIQKGELFIIVEQTPADRMVSSSKFASSVEYSDGLIQFVSPGECHIGVTKLLKSVVAREGSPPPGLSVLTRYHGDDEVLAFLPTMDKSGRDADLQFFINDSKDGPVQWQRGSQWYSSPEHSTTHGIYCSQSEYLMLVDVPFAYPSNYDPWDLTGPMNPPVNLDMLTQGGLVVQLNSESRSSLTALKRVDYPLNNPSAEAFTSSDPGPTTIVDFEGFPIDSSAPGNVTEVSMFETLRCVAFAEYIED